MWVHSLIRELRSQKLHSAAKIRKNIWHSLGLFSYTVSLILTMIMWRRLVLLVLSVEKTEVWQLSPGGIARRWQSLYLNSALLGTIPFATVPPPYWFWNPLKGRFVNEGFWVTISWDEYLSFHGYHLLYTFSSVLKNSQPLYVQILFLYLFLFPSGLLVEIYIIPSHYIPFFCFFLSFVCLLNTCKMKVSLHLFFAFFF